MTAAMVTAALLGMCFSPTRWLGIAATSALAFDRPWLTIVVVLGILSWLYLFKVRK